ncbi:Octapeptide-repeat protein T2, partial [Ophiophagus hannah]
MQTAVELDSEEERRPVRESGKDSDKGPVLDAGMGPEPYGSGVLPLEPLESGSSEAEDLGEPVPTVRVRRAARRKGDRVGKELERGRGWERKGEVQREGKRRERKAEREGRSEEGRSREGREGKGGEKGRRKGRERREGKGEKGRE